MTATATMTDPATDTWTRQLEQLKARYKHVRPAILVALTILLHDQNIAIEDAKAQAELHGTRITAASMNAARTLLSKMDAPAATTTRVAQPTTAAAPATTRAPRRPRAADAPLDAEAMIRSMVDKLQAQGSAETERLREAMRKAVDVLRAAVG